MTGFGTSVQLLSFDLKNLKNLKKAEPANTQCFKNFNFKTNSVIMQPAGQEIKLLTRSAKAAAVRHHVFAVGTQVVACAPDVVGAMHLEDLRKQVYPPEPHTPNPTPQS